MPLLWVIYYNPMFEAINQSPHSGIAYVSTLPIKIPSDFPDVIILAKNFEIKVQSYLDDITWLTDNLENLEQNLKITDDFYQLANIKTNKDKTKLLTKNKSVASTPTYPITFGQDIIVIEILPLKKVLVSWAFI